MDWHSFIVMFDHVRVIVQCVVLEDYIVSEA